MNLITLKTILDKASVPYEFKEKSHEFVILSNGEYPAAEFSTVYQLKGTVSYIDIAHWYVPEKAMLIAAVINDFLMTPKEEREEGTLNDADMSYYSQRFAGPFGGTWDSPKIGESKEICDDWYKRMVKEYRKLYVMNAKLGQRIDQNYCGEVDDDKDYFAAMIDQFEATKDVLEALEKRIMFVINETKNKNYGSLTKGGLND